MPRLLIGTSGWHYKHWRARFYPQDLPPSQWLRFYATHFSTVEINASFYRQQPAPTWEKWRKTVPEGFLFAAKASRFITHIKRLADPADPLGRFLGSVAGLSDHLGPLLYQLPPSFQRTEENVTRLEAFIELLPARLMHVIEFRHKSWFGDETMGMLRSHRVAFCSFDRAGFDCPLIATAPHAYMRFHGSSGERGGNYTDKMLEAWAARLEELAAGVERLFVYFNNDAFGYAVQNASSLAKLLGVKTPTRPRRQA